jgi:hypothetical protein
MSEKFPSQIADKFVIRLPDGLRDKIKEAAAANGRSMNSEIIARLDGGTAALRDLFAGQAMAGLLASPREPYAPAGENPLGAQTLSKLAYAQADAMLAARESTP